MVPNSLVAHKPTELNTLREIKKTCSLLFNNVSQVEGITYILPHFTSTSLKVIDLLN